MSWFADVSLFKRPQRDDDLIGQTIQNLGAIIGSRLYPTGTSNLVTAAAKVW